MNIDPSECRTCGDLANQLAAANARCAELEAEYKSLEVGYNAQVQHSRNHYVRAEALQATLDRVTALADSRMAGLRGFIVVKELVDALGGSYDYTGCGQWDGTPGAGYCCDLPVGHAGPHHADHHWPRAALTPEGKP